MRSNEILSHLLQLDCPATALLGIAGDIIPVAEVLFARRLRLTCRLLVKLDVIHGLADLGDERRFQTASFKIIPFETLKERMALHRDVALCKLGRAKAALRHLVDEPATEVLRRFGHCCRKSHACREHQGQHCRFLGCVERRLTVQHLVGEDAQGPPIHHQAVGALLHDLRSHILGCSTHRVGLSILKVLCEAEVGELQMP
mmetsp:Transcript_68415/g.160432  ORF Transcript_68415/g.160432 Transcript_68415/m.160432 type:complete len:201 (+) Transcript_68415:215-817(+)